MATRRRSRRTRQPPDDRKARILEAAKALFAEHGTGEVTTAAIARQAGVSEGLIFHHFGSKRNLLAEIAASYGHGVATAMFSEIHPGKRPDVHAMVRHTFDYVAEHGKMHDLLAMSADPADWNAALHANRGVIIAALSQAFSQWAEAGWIETERPDIAAALMFGLVESALMDCFVRGHEERLDDYVDECVACIEGALGYEGPDA